MGGCFGRADGVHAALISNITKPGPASTATVLMEYLLILEFENDADGNEPNLTVDYANRQSVLSESAIIDFNSVSHC
jgi:hypothetical protein